MEYRHRPHGASQEELALLAHKYLVSLPEDIRSFMAISDGPTLWFGFKELQFLSIAEILRDDYRIQIYMTNGLPLCLDGSGNICVARVLNHDISGYYAADCGNLGWDDAVKIADKFDEFLADNCSPEQRLHG